MELKLTPSYTLILTCSSSLPCDRSPQSPPPSPHCFTTPEQAQQLLLCAQAQPCIATQQWQTNTQLTLCSFATPTNATLQHFEAWHPPSRSPTSLSGFADALHAVHESLQWEGMRQYVVPLPCHKASLTNLGNGQNGPQMRTAGSACPSDAPRATVPAPLSPLPLALDETPLYTHSRQRTRPHARQNNSRPLSPPCYGSIARTTMMSALSPHCHGLIADRITTSTSREVSSVHIVCWRLRSSGLSRTQQAAHAPKCTPEQHSQRLSVHVVSWRLRLQRPIAQVDAQLAPVAARDAHGGVQVRHVKGGGAEVLGRLEEVWQLRHVKLRQALRGWCTGG